VAVEQGLEVRVISRAWLLACIVTLVGTTSAALAQAQVTKYVRYSVNGKTAYGIVDGESIHELADDPFASPRKTGVTVAMADVRLLAPCEPSKIIAVGLNYQSHLGEREPAEYPGLFAKYPTSIVGPGDDIVIPPDSSNLHFEGELVLVIGKKAQNVSVDEASEYIFGVTAGNDVSERDWQRADLQWVRAKASDTFAPLGPVIARGLDYDQLRVQTRLNGKLEQSGNSDDLIFDPKTIVSYVSRYVTLLPGDVIFTGTPGTTSAMKPGDSVEVEVEGVGVLRNQVAGSEP
jgi:2-keto-4-pentenoate hydratase/2-oxohepta-3-ene-1,7-dioic acid hydratase in catechol pathway